MPTQNPNDATGFLPRESVKADNENWIQQCSRLPVLLERVPKTAAAAKLQTIILTIIFGGAEGSANHSVNMMTAVLVEL